MRIDLLETLRGRMQEITGASGSMGERMDRELSGGPGMGPRLRLYNNGNLYPARRLEAALPGVLGRQFQWVGSS